MRYWLGALARSRLQQDGAGAEHRKPVRRAGDAADRRARRRRDAPPPPPPPPEPAPTPTSARGARRDHPGGRARDRVRRAAQPRRSRAGHVVARARSPTALPALRRQALGPRRRDLDRRPDLRQAAPSQATAKIETDGEAARGDEVRDRAARRRRRRPRDPAARDDADVRRLQTLSPDGQGDRSDRDADADHPRARRGSRPARSLHRDKEPTHRPWIAVYGGALHNDRFPEPGVAEWSYAAAIDKVDAAVTSSRST